MDADITINFFCPEYQNLNKTDKAANAEERKIKALYLAKGKSFDPDLTRISYRGTKISKRTMNKTKQSARILCASSLSLACTMAKLYLKKRRTDTALIIEL
jgi:hypothetical protein